MRPFNYFLIHFLLFFSLPSILLADLTYNNRVEVAIQGGGTFFEGNSNLDDAGIVGGRLGYFVTNHISLEAALFSGQTEYDNRNLDADLLLPQGELLFHASKKAVRPFFSLGGGLLKIDPEQGTNQSDFLVQLGAGYKWLLGNHLLARLDGRYHLNLEDGTGPSLGSLTLGLGWIFGQGQAEKTPPAQDYDGDGILDTIDECPNTPRGVGVNRRGCPYDDDEDGVPNELDQCPQSPPNQTVDANGCSDRDGDGVPDNKDLCSDTPAGLSVNSQGCSDQDQDGILDDKDQCPTEKETRNQFEDQDGCPDKKPVPKKAWILNNIQFTPGSSQLTNKSRPVLIEAVQILKDNPVVRVEIQGHTDNIGREKFNETLSLERAKAVRDFLLEQGIDSSRLEVKGLGESNPIASNSTKEGRRKNRRIEFKVLER